MRFCDRYPYNNQQQLTIAVAEKPEQQACVHNYGSCEHDEILRLTASENTGERLR